MTCEKCGSPIADNEKFCSNCGAKVAATEGATSENVNAEAEVKNDMPLQTETVSQEAPEAAQQPEAVAPTMEEVPPQPQPQQAAPQPQVVYVQPDAQTNQGVYPPVDPRKSKLVGGLFGIFLGTFGVHNFYLGYTTKAVIQVSVTGACILLSICTMGISAFGIIGIEIWGLIEGIMILGGSINVDGKGIPLKD